MKSLPQTSLKKIAQAAPRGPNAQAKVRGGPENNETTWNSLLRVGALKVQDVRHRVEIMRTTRGAKAKEMERDMERGREQRRGSNTA